MNNNGWTIKIIDVGYRFTRDIFIFRPLAPGKIEVVRGDTVEVIDEDGTLPQPSLRLDPQALQAFADALHEMGIKPQQGFVEGKLAATETHLQDLRQLLKLK